MVAQVAGNARAEGCYNDTAHQCGFVPAGSSAENDYAVAAKRCVSGGNTVAGAEDGLGVEIFCGKTATPPCPKLPALACKPGGCPGNHSQSCGDGWVLQIIEFDSLPGPPVKNVGFSMRWGLRVGGGGADARDDAKGAGHRLGTLAVPEVRVDCFCVCCSRSCSRLCRHSMLALIHLGDGGTLTTGYCATNSSGGRSCGCCARSTRSERTDSSCRSSRLRPMTTPPSRPRRYTYYGSNYYGYTYHGHTYHGYTYHGCTYHGCTYHGYTY